MAVVAMPKMNADIKPKRIIKDYQVWTPSRPVAWLCVHGSNPNPPLRPSKITKLGRLVHDSVGAQAASNGEIELLRTPNTPKHFCSR
jgi:hypothetical protein